jgi:hypothetical protein
MADLFPEASNAFKLPIFSNDVVTVISASARISKGQGYQVFLRKRAGSSFGQKRAICIIQGKT